MTIWNSDSHTKAVIRCWAVNENIQCDLFGYWGEGTQTECAAISATRRHNTRLRNECNG